MNEIDFSTADFDDINKFAMNLLTVRRIEHPGDYEAQIAYFSTSTQVVLGRKAAESAAKLAAEVDSARLSVAGGLDRLEKSIAGASEASDSAATRMITQSQRMVRATWGLVVVTGLLVVATALLVIYTRQLAVATPPVVPATIGARGHE
jgi:hypothetical protein